MTSSKRVSKDTYLHQPKGRNMWHVRVSVPRTLVKQVGQTHIIRSLQTTSKAAANDRKHAAVAKIKAALAELRKRPAGSVQPAMSLDAAREFRAQLEALYTDGDHETAITHELVASTHAEAIERVHGEAAAVRWFRAATSSDETLTELQGRWLADSDVRESTKAGHRKALRDLLQFMGNKDAHPQDLTHAKALDFLDNNLKASGLAYNTIRDRRASLASFWGWLEGRKCVPRGSNPWAGHKLSKQRHPGTRPPKRKGGFTDAELLRLLEGNERARGWPTWVYLPDLMVLGMFSGARLETICALTAGNVTAHPEGYVVQIEADKTEAGKRPVGFTHPAPVAVIRRRLEGRSGAESLFPELRPGGLDDKLGASATKAFGRYRRACEVPDGTDFHSFRRNVTTILEHADLTQGEIARFVGQKVGTLAADTYAGQRRPDWALKVSKRIHYSAEVEGAAQALAKR